MHLNYNFANFKLFYVRKVLVCLYVDKNEEKVGEKGTISVLLVHKVFKFFSSINT